MGGSRIFVGNLSVDVNENQLLEKFSKYGNVINIELKNKVDIDGNPVSQFAYLNVESEQAKIKDCIQDLNNIKWNGSFLKVEIARESFLDRLKREREKANKPKSNETPHTVSYDSEANYEKQQYKPRHDIHADSYDESYNNYGNSYNNNSMDFADDTTDETATNYSHGQSNKSQKSQWGEQESYTTFKRYDPTLSDKNSSNIQKKAQEQVPEESSKKFAHISSNLNFNEESSAFSLLAKFSENRGLPEQRGSQSRPTRASTTADSDVTRRSASEDTSRRGETHQQDDSSREKKFVTRPKSKNFFLTSHDAASFQESVDWLLTPLTEENRAEFESARSELVNLYKLRQNRATRNNASNKRGSKRRNFGIGRPKYRSKK